MGLYGWAGTSRGSSGSRGTKVEIFQDPGSYDGSASKFEEWWTKMNAWLVLRDLRNQISSSTHSSVCARTLRVPDLLDSCWQ